MVQDMPRATECFSAICSLQERDKLVPASNLSCQHVVQLAPTQSLASQ